MDIAKTHQPKAISRLDCTLVVNWPIIGISINNINPPGEIAKPATCAVYQRRVCKNSGSITRLANKTTYKLNIITLAVAKLKILKSFTSTTGAS
jgi:hypothetical protein